MNRSFMKTADNMLKYAEIMPSGNTFSHWLKHNEVQGETNRMGYFVLFTDTKMSAEDILRKYGQKNVVGKAFMYSIPCMQPLYARYESGTSSSLFFSIYSYTIKAMMPSMSGMTYQQTEKIILSIKEALSTSGSHSVVELT